jgi:pyruvate dehydrogenase E1 component
LNGEGLQHQDGQGLLFASAVPNCLAYDPAFAYEVAVIIKKGIERMYHKGENVFYYVTLLNENYSHPDLPEGVEEGIDRGMYLFQKGKKGKLRVQLMGSGAIFREVIAAAGLLAEDYDVQADIWSVLGINQLHRQGMEVEDWNRRHPEEKSKRSYVEEVLEGYDGPAIMSTDYVQTYGEQLRRFIPNRLTVLGTDGFGRSDSRAKLRDFFGVDRYHIVIAALKALAEEDKIAPAEVKKALKKYKIDTETAHPLKR